MTERARSSTVDRGADHRRPLRLRPGGRPRSTVLVVMVAVAGLAASCGAQTPASQAPAGSPTASSPVATGEVTSTTRQTPPSSAGWQPAPDQASVSGVQFESVAWTGTRFVAAGPALGGSWAFMDSIDGLSWHRQSSGGDTANPAHLAPGRGGVVAVGRIDNRPASWFSPDGLTWTPSPEAFPVTGVGSDTIEVTGVVATEDGWLAVGREDPFCNMNCGLAPIRAIVWTSPDGLDWTRVADAPALGGAGMTAVTRGGPGFVAVGLAGAIAAVWVSTDGTSWTRIADEPLFHELPSADPSLWTTMTAVAAGHGVIIAVGNEGPGGAHGPAARAWWSADGRTWAPAVGEAFASGGEIDVRLGGVTVTPDGFLAVGFSTGGCVGGLWASTDGRAWRCDAAGGPLAGFIPTAAAVAPSVEVAVGFATVGEPPPQGFPGAVWWRPIP